MSKPVPTGEVICGGCKWARPDGCHLHFAKMTNQEVADVVFDGDLEKVRTYTYGGLAYYNTGSDPAQAQALNGTGRCGHYQRPWWKVLTCT